MPSPVFISATQPEVQGGAAHQLHVEVALPERAAGGLPDERERLGEQVVEGVEAGLPLGDQVAGPVEAAAELAGEGPQLLVAALLHLGLQHAPTSGTTDSRPLSLRPSPACSMRSKRPIAAASVPVGRRWACRQGPSCAAPVVSPCSATSAGRSPADTRTASLLIVASVTLLAAVLIAVVPSARTGDPRVDVAARLFLVVAVGLGAIVAGSRLSGAAKGWLVVFLLGAALVVGAALILNANGFGPFGTQLDQSFRTATITKFATNWGLARFRLPGPARPGTRR